MLVQQLSVKLFAAEPDAVRLDGFAPIFHRWIQESRLPGRLLIDVADYRHVPDGPGIVLVAHEAHYAIDRERGGLGLLVSRKRDQPGELGDKLTEAFRDALTAARMLEEDPDRPIRFRGDRVRVGVMSRRYADASSAALDAARPELGGFAARLWDGLSVRMEAAPGDPRGPFAVELEAPGAPGVAELLARLA
jgi:hypothetical protein